MTAAATDTGRAKFAASLNAAVVSLEPFQIEVDQDGNREKQVK